MNKKVALIYNPIYNHELYINLLKNQKKIVLKNYEKSYTTDTQFTIII